LFFLGIAWFFDGKLVTSDRKKTWIYALEQTHYLNIYDVCKTDVGQYSVAMYDHKGNETRESFSLGLKGNF